VMVPGRHDWPALSQRSSKHCPHEAPSLNSAVLSAAVLVPYPVLYRFPYPHAPPANTSSQCQLNGAASRPSSIDQRRTPTTHPLCRTRRRRRRTWRGRSATRRSRRRPGGRGSRGLSRAGRGGHWRSPLLRTHTGTASLKLKRARSSC